MELSDIYVREKDKLDARIRNLEQRYKIIENDNLVLRQRLAVVEDKFRQEPMPSDVGQVEHISELTLTDSGTSNMVKMKKTRTRKASGNTA